MELTDKEKTRLLFDYLCDFSKKYFGYVGEIQPMWLLSTGQGVTPMITPFEDYDHKVKITDQIKAKIKADGVERYAFVAEAWMVSVKRDAIAGNVSPEEWADGIRPSTHEDRREVIQLHAHDKFGNKFFGQYFILRPEHGKPKLSPLDEKEESLVGLKGLMVEMF